MTVLLGNAELALGRGSPRTAGPAWLYTVTLTGCVSVSQTISKIPAKHTTYPSKLEAYLDLALLAAQAGQGAAKLFSGELWMSSGLVPGRVAFIHEHRIRIVERGCTTKQSRGVTQELGDTGRRCCMAYASKGTDKAIMPESNKRANER